MFELSRAILIAYNLFVAFASTNNTCFGVKPEYDAQCAKYTTKAKCQQQVGCSWGNQAAATCEPKDDPQLKAACAKFHNKTSCDKQIACVWRSDSDLSKWISAANAAVQGLSATAKTLPESVSYVIQTTTSTHAHQSVSGADLAGVLEAWQTKYGLPGDAVSAMSALVAVESVGFKSVQKVVRGDSGKIAAIAAAGRNWNDYVSVAFVYGTTSAQVTTYYADLTCLPVHITGHSQCEGDPGGKEKCVCAANRGIRCAGWPNQPSQSCHRPQSRDMTASEVAAVDNNLQADLFPKISAEGTLLEADLKHGVRLDIKEKTVV